ncbi:MAG: hypothetical protein SGI86_17745 [Deltaproteobacteria bacterium]|nr:hypothetical protein [Deltaproteobacteria bacterium]
MTKQSTTRRLVTSLALLTIPAWLGPFAWWLAYQQSVVLSYLGLLLLSVELAFVLLALFAVGVIVAGPVLLLFRTYRPGAVLAVGQAILFLVSFAGGLFLGRVVWRDCVKEVVERAEPLVTAIHEYTDAHGNPPGSLDELVPQHIAAIPSTSVGAFPNFRYVVDEPERYDGNPWVLLVIPPCHPMGFDLLMYFPLRNYPDVGYGGSLERIGAWAYVHE